MIECNFVNSTRIICNEITIGGNMIDPGFLIITIIYFAILGLMYFSNKHKIYMDKTSRKMLVDMAIAHIRTCPSAAYITTPQGRCLRPELDELFKKLGIKKDIIRGAYYE